MRSALVFAAQNTLNNRFALCQTAAKATRSFHVAHTRIEDTTNEVLQRIAESDGDHVRYYGHGNPSHRRRTPSPHRMSEQLKRAG